MLRRGSILGRTQRRFQETGHAGTQREVWRFDLGELNLQTSTDWPQRLQTNCGYFIGRYLRTWLMPAAPPWWSNCGRCTLIGGLLSGLSVLCFGGCFVSLCFSFSFFMIIFPVILPALCYYPHLCSLFNQPNFLQSLFVSVFCGFCWLSSL